MIFLIISIVMLAIGIGMIRTKWDSVVGFTLSMLGTISLLTIVIVWPLSYYDYESQIQQYYAVKQSIEQSRNSNLSDVERVALTNKIIEINQWLSSLRYWNETIFDDFIPDEVTKLEYLK